MIKQIYKYIQYGVYYLLPAVLLGLLAFVRDPDLAEEAGSIALALLALAVFLKPIAQIINHKYLTRLLVTRKEIGIACFWFFIYHFIGLMTIHNIAIAELYNTNSFIFWGSLAGIGIFLLGITSNFFSMKLLKKNWKRLHYLVYPTFFFALYHGAKAEGEMANFYIGSAAFILIKLAAYLIQKKRLKKKLSLKN